MRTAGIGLAVVAAVAAATLASTMNAWRQSTVAKVEQLRRAGTPRPGAFSPALVEGLPAPVARYFRRALKDGQPFITWAVARQDAEFFANNAWRPLRATQHFNTVPPGFVWDARIAMAPLMPADVRDAYVAGHGSMQATMFGAYSLVDQSALPQLDSGALQRYLGEAVWFPTALLPGMGVTWQAVDDRSALATLTDGSTTVSLTFRFDDQDRIIEAIGDRYFERDGGYELRPWRVRCSDHSVREGIEIPQSCEVAWIRPQGPEPYWRGRISSIVYSFN